MFFCWGNGAKNGFVCWENPANDGFLVGKSKNRNRPNQTSVSKFLGVKKIYNLF